MKCGTWRGKVNLLAAIIADTHIPRRARKLPDALLPYLERADVILHAGDLLVPLVLEDLARFAPVHAVRGNVDGPAVDLPEALELDLGILRMAMIHDAGRRDGRRERMRRKFPGARVIVFGHSHEPFLEDDGELMLLNPGSPTDRRRQPRHTFAMLRAGGGEVKAEIIPL